jgi:NitT/TauT family transport system substrate-binding protein
VHLLQLFQHSHLTLVAWKDKGVHTPADLDAQPVSLWQGSFSLVYEAFFHKHRTSPLRLPQYSSIQLFLRRGVAAAAAMEYNELNRLYLSGIDPEQLTVFRMRDEGLGLPEDGLYARADWARRHPQAAKALVQATLKGWKYARQHPEETLDTVLKQTERAGVVTNRAHERWMLNTVLASIFVAGAPTEAAGRLDRQAFERATKSLLDAGLIDTAPTFDAFRFPAP